ncbi:unnamed protein product [Effrenium voratum]|uniref:PH domain-containing protein n=1 Tax=Effrenium voratum TaxID=2562239 RepID=A0AA36MZ05_9DINO|nr:unnamed protein product [Effrenium voratum]
MVSQACRCLCSGDWFDEAEQLEFDGLGGAAAPIPPARFSDLLAYSTDMGQPLRGKAMRSGDLWFLRSEASAEKVQVSLFVNGIAIEHKGKEVRACFSPFTLVRNCKFQDSSSINQLSSLKIFKIFFFVKNLCYFFGVSADDEAQADKDRQLWVSSIAKAVHLVTQSLFPPFSISCEPICAAAVTSRRLMAGYVLYHSGEDVATVLYGELSPHTRGSDLARLAFYENEQCQRLAMEIWISVASNCFEKVGMSCTCFCINGHDFSARTTAERKLWLRAISNIKVKLQNSAPAPSREDLAHYREAIEEQVRSLENSLEGRGPVDSLLQRIEWTRTEVSRVSREAEDGTCSSSISSEEGLGTAAPRSGSVFGASKLHSLSIPALSQPRSVAREASRGPGTPRAFAD